MGDDAVIKALALQGFDRPPAVIDVPAPQRASGELLVRVHAASVNAYDAFVAMGMAKDFMAYEFPAVLGQDVAGVVEAAGGEVEGFHEGDRVFGTIGAKGKVHDGTFAELSTPLATALVSKVRAPVDTPPPSTPLSPTPPVNLPQAPALNIPGAAPATVTMVSTVDNTLAQQPQQPRITIAWEKADIRDVLAAFAAFSGRTIIPAKGVEATITAEIIDKPWDVAMKAILNAYGFDAVEDQNGIIVVNTLEALAQKPHFEQLRTVTVRFNYTNPTAVAAALQSRLSKDCGTLQTTGTVAGAPAVQLQGPQNCPVRGSVTADTLTNTVSITDVPSSLESLVAYAKTLDVRQPQVNIKAKIVLVDRTSLEGLGLRYDLGTQSQFFNDIVPRLDSAGQPRSDAGQIVLGGNMVSAIANATARVPAAALQLIYSTAIGGFDFTTFLEALQQTSLLDVQAEPSASVLNNRTANLTAGTQVPIRVIDASSGGTNTGSFPRATVRIQETGIILNVTPQVTANRQIQMRVHVENSDVQDLGGDIGAVFPRQSVDNEVLVGDGETAVMGGPATERRQRGPRCRRRDRGHGRTHADHRPPHEVGPPAPRRPALPRSPLRGDFATGDEARPAHPHHAAHHRRRPAAVGPEPPLSARETTSAWSVLMKRTLLIRLSAAAAVIALIASCDQRTPVTANIHGGGSTGGGNPSAPAVSIDTVQPSPVNVGDSILVAVHVRDDSAIVNLLARCVRSGPTVAFAGVP